MRGKETKSYGRHTESVLSLVGEVINEGAAHLDSRPLLFVGVGSHIEQSNGGRGVIGSRELREGSRREVKWNLGVSQPTSATVEQARDHPPFTRGRATRTGRTIHS